MGMKIHRGDVVICAFQGDYGKPRPAIVVQSDLFNEVHESLTLCPITSDLKEAPLFRVSLRPKVSNGLKVESQVMVDKIVSIQRDKIKQKIGRLSETELHLLQAALNRWLQL